MSTHQFLDSEFIDKIIFEVKSQGLFDCFRKECLADVDTQPAYQNLHSRVEDTVQRFLNRQVWTPEIKNKNRLREDMRMNIIRAGFLENGVSRIVDQVVEQKMDLIQSKVEEILYKHAGIEKPKKEENHNGSLEVNTTLLPTDLEQVSPDSDKRSSYSPNKEEIEEEIIDDDDFESPAFEPIEPLGIENAFNNSHNSNLSEISGLTSQEDSAENKSPQKSEEPTTIGENGQGKQLTDTALSQISSTQDNITDITHTPIATLTLTGISGEEAQMAIGLNDSTENEHVTKNEKELKKDEVFQFDLNKDTIEFTGTERKSINLDDSTNSGESEKVAQTKDIHTMEIDNTYENDTTDSSELRMEIDLKDESTQGTVNSSKIEDSSQDSLTNKDKRNDKRDRKLNKSNSHHHSSSSSKSKQYENSRHKNNKHKKSSRSRDRSSSSRKDRDKDKKSLSKSKHESIDDHHQEKLTHRRRSTDHDDSCNSKDNVKTAENSSKYATKSTKETDSTKASHHDKSSTNKASITDQTLIQNKCEKPIDVSKTFQQNLKTKEQKTSILVKYDYLKSKEGDEDDEKTEVELLGFENFVDETKNNPWFDCMRLVTSKQISLSSNNNYLNKNQEGQLNISKKAIKQKAKNTDASEQDTNLNQNSLTDDSAIQQKVQNNQQQRYDAKDLYKPKFDFRRGRRGQI